MNKNQVTSVPALVESFVFECSYFITIETTVIKDIFLLFKKNVYAIV